MATVTPGQYGTPIKSVRDWAGVRCAAAVSGRRRHGNAGRATPNHALMTAMLPPSWRVAAPVARVLLFDDEVTLLVWIGSHVDEAALAWLQPAVERTATDRARLRFPHPTIRHLRVWRGGSGTAGGVPQLGPGKTHAQMQSCWGWQERRITGGILNEPLPGLPSCAVAQGPSPGLRTGHDNREGRGRANARCSRRHGVYRGAVAMCMTHI